MTVKPMEEHFRTLAKKEKIGNLERGRGVGGTPKRKENNRIMSQNDFGSPAKRRKLSNAFNYEKLHTFWTAKSKPSNTNFRKTMK